MQTQLKRFQEALKGSNADAAIISSELNQHYLSGFPFTDGFLLITTDKAYMITDSRYVEAAKNTAKEFEVLLPEKSMLETIAELLREAGAKQVAIEDEEVSVALYERFKSKISEVCEIVNGASALLVEQRKIKLPYELELMAKAQSITDAAFAHILDYITPDVTETDVAVELEFFMRRMGAEALAFETIAVSGAASSMPHGVPSNVKLRKGFLTMDFGDKYNGYCSDMTRTVVIGKADEDMKKLYNTVLSAQTAALELAAEGVSCEAVDAAARNIINGAGYEGKFGHGLGHGVGMFIHESPRLSPRVPAEEVLKRGHVVTVEPGIYLEGKYGCRIEDMIAIDLDGKMRNFTKSPKHLIEL